MPTVFQTVKVFGEEAAVRPPPRLSAMRRASERCRASASRFLWLLRVLFRRVRRLRRSSGFTLLSRFYIIFIRRFAVVSDADPAAELLVIRETYHCADVNGIALELK